MRVDNVHVPISVLCYLCCLLLPAFYLGERYEPGQAFEVLLTGWLGPLDGHFSWFANPLYWGAIICKSKPGKSAALGVFALLLAASFLLHQKIMVSELPSYEEIVAYGWGYALWLVALAIFSIGQLLHAFGVEGRWLTTASISCLILLLTAYAVYYFVGTNSIFSIHSGREIEFQQRCASAGVQIFKTSHDVNGVFFDPDFERHIYSRARNNELKFIGGAGRMGLSALNSGEILFYETKDRNNPQGYIKYRLEGHNEVQEPTGRLESEYAVITNYPEIPARFNISGALITISDLRDGTVLAKGSYYIQNETGRFCGGSPEGFSTTALMTEVLGLARKKPAAFE